MSTPWCLIFLVLLLTRNSLDGEEFTRRLEKKKENHRVIINSYEKATSSYSNTIQQQTQTIKSMEVASGARHKQLVTLAAELLKSQSKANENYLSKAEFEKENYALKEEMAEKQVAAIGLGTDEERARNDAEACKQECEELKMKLRDIMNLCMGKPDASEGSNSKRQRLE